MGALPAGTVTFLFTDIEGSTRLLQRHGDEFQDLLEIHSRLIRQAIAEADGVEVSTEGDSFFVVFASAPDAVRAAVAAQRALAAHSWPPEGEVRVRMGIHTGEGTLGGDSYVGIDVHRAARVADAAHGGQVVLSASTATVVEHRLPAGVFLRHLGDHSLKDLAHPEHLSQLVVDGLPDQFPPLHSLEGSPNNLPVQLSSFLGREETREKIREVVDTSRLVTLVGPGGVGKTRLALQVAADRIERHPDGVWLAELAGLADAELVPQAVRAALGVPEQPGQPTMATLVGYLERRDLLLVLDNCEHLIDAAAELTDTLLGAAAGVRVLATSREPLNVPGEVSWQVPPMMLPEADDSVSLGNPPEAVMLFAERARAADPGFELSERTAPSVVAICRRVDGLPLAIELAATRVRSLSVESIAGRLEDRLTVLSGGSRTALPRQQTLEATVGWSYDLLNKTEQVVFSRLGVFAGSFDLSAAERVAAADDIEADQILDVVTGLVDRSLLAVVRDQDDVRYRMLDTIRHYARTRLAESGDLPRIEEAHTGWVLDFAEEATKRMVGPEMRLWLGRINATFDDIRAVLERSLEHGEPETGLRLLTALELFLILSAVREGAYWLDELLSAGESAPEILAPALAVRGELLIFQGDARAAAPVLERSLELFEAVDDPSARARAQLDLAAAMWETDAERVPRLLTSALKTFQTIWDPTGLTRSLWALVLWEFQRGDPPNAERFASQLESLGEETGAPLIKAHAAEAYGLRAHFAGRTEQAQTHFTEAVGQYREAGFVQCLAHCLDHIALWALKEGHPERAARLLGSVEALREEHIGTGVRPFERAWHDQVTADAYQQLGASTFDRHFQEGRQSLPEDATELAAAALLAHTTDSTTST
ncbi:MAG: adenylate/guanylate cyclase domain-containing protein [Acidimicrobiia bacterium]